MPECVVCGLPFEGEGSGYLDIGTFTQFHPTLRVEYPVFYQYSNTNYTVHRNRLINLLPLDLEF